jgi:hypothetical protein
MTRDQKKNTLKVSTGRNSLHFIVENMNFFSNGHQISKSAMTEEIFFAVIATEVSFPKMYLTPQKPNV